MDTSKERHIRVAEGFVNPTAIDGTNALERRSTKEKDAEDFHTDERDIRTKQVRWLIQIYKISTIDENPGIWWALPLLVGFSSSYASANHNSFIDPGWPTSRSG